MSIPRFYYPEGIVKSQHDEYILRTINKVKDIYEEEEYLSVFQYLPVTKLCGLPEYLNMAFFQKLESMGRVEMRVSFTEFIQGWAAIARHSHSDHSLFFHILKKQSCDWITPEDFLPVLEDIISNHPALGFLSSNPMFQERYIETVICRIFYEANCTSGRMKLYGFCKSKFVEMIKALGPDVDLNNTRDCFSYRHFYVIYCKFWTLDEDHDLILSRSDLLRYNGCALSNKLTDQLMVHGRIPAFTRNDPQCIPFFKNNPALTYLDFIWLLLSDIDKSTPVAIEYWFKCIDSDGDGIITTCDLHELWQERLDRSYRTLDSYFDDSIIFDDIICQINDLVQPSVPGQFRLSDLKRNGLIAERFLDTFMSLEKFFLHDAHQGLIRMTHQLEMKRRQIFEEYSTPKLTVHGKAPSPPKPRITIDRNGRIKQIEHFDMFTLGTWCEYAEKEYYLLIYNEQCDSVITLEDSGDEEECNGDELEMYKNDNASFPILSPCMIDSISRIGKNYTLQSEPKTETSIGLTEDHVIDTSISSKSITYGNQGERWAYSSQNTMHNSQQSWCSVAN
ncbi:hypothetical protein BDB01DRAFT_736224 [Pilobolus umbonatus]|nr:hypothetical protein BDB01DRAFT_736224 [Pilobolus umbonatus]